MKTKIYVPDIECDSCVKIISKKFKNVEGIKDFKISEDSVVVEHTDPVEKVIKTIEGAGFRASLEPFERKTFKERIKDFKENSEKYKLEKTGIKYAIYTFFLLVAFEILAYFTFLNKIPNFLEIYGWWFAYLTISTVALGVGVWHFYSYNARITCMVGMMVGMTFGMQTGMMIGAIIGATNGFFVGATTGMILGSLIGILTGKCCGVMGVMEGMMAGLMGGTMGPMITLMMFFDHLLIFMPIYMLINVIILLGSSYMLFEEVVESKNNIKTRKIDFLTYSMTTVIITLLLAAIILYAPKSAYILGGI